MKRFRKLVIAGALVLTPLLSAASASAASPNTAPYHRVIVYSVNLSNIPSVSVLNETTLCNVAKKYGIDLSKLTVKYPELKQYKWQWPVDTSKKATAPKQKTPQPAPQPSPQPANPQTGKQGNNQTVISDYAKQVFNLVNQERQKAGLQPLTLNKELSVVALDKAKDMYYNGYFSHQSPTFGSPFEMMRNYGISFRTAGENIAKGQRTPQEVMEDWMNSPGHRANILNPNFKSIGVAHFNGVWVQMFIG